MFDFLAMTSEINTEFDNSNVEINNDNKTIVNVDWKDLKELEQVPRLSGNQFKFVFPFRCIFFR